MLPPRVAALADGCLAFAIAAVASCTVLAFFSEQLWAAELALHFRVQYLAIALATGVLCALRKRWFTTACAIGISLVNAWPSAPYLWTMSAGLAAPLNAAEHREGNLLVLALNLFYRNREHGRVRELLKSRSPDVLVLTELTSSWARELQTVTGTYPYSIAVSRESPWGMGVYSRYPLDEARVMDLGALGSVNVTALLHTPTRLVRLFAVHLASPTSPAATDLRNLQLRDLAEILTDGGSGISGSVPRIVVGDLNVTPFSPRFSLLLRRTGLADARLGHGWQATWPADFAPLRIPIDHCLVEPGIDVREFTTGPAVGSDHLPIEVRLQLHRESAG
jgi:endonuclease/exonuclease/phosphatase (EEP) superfamily protein YafD